MAKLYTLLALCAVGAEKTVSNELKKLDLSVVESSYGRVSFRAELKGIYSALIGLRAADRVLLEAGNFEAEDFDALFDGVQGIPWEDYIPPNTGIKVDKVRTNRSLLKAETSIQGIVHKAAADRLCKKRRVNRLIESSDDVEIRVYIEKNAVSVLLDLAGDPLFKRGYRIRGGAAPIRETTAAALILHSMWKRKFPFFDPFCGTGTFVIEAAMYAWDMAPGLSRRFAMEKLLIQDRKTEDEVRNTFIQKIDFSRRIRIGGSDSDENAVLSARANLEKTIALNTRKNRQSMDSIDIPINIVPMEKAKAFISKEAEDDKGYIITNPPYGRRMGDREEAENIYKNMSKLAHNFGGWKLGVITEHPGFESFFGRKADSCREISNGAIPAYFFQYENI